MCLISRGRGEYQSPCSDLSFEGQCDQEILIKERSDALGVLVRA